MQRSGSALQGENAQTVNGPTTQPPAAHDERRGKTTIAPDVLLTIARLSALGVPGVARVEPVPGGVDRLFKRGVHDGVRIAVKDHAVTVDLYLVLEHDRNVREISRAVQTAVARAMHEMVAMDVLAVNIHIEDVAYPEQEAQ
jgi:uncharacterized alkaline shock family protein YloU